MTTLSQLRWEGYIKFDSLHSHPSCILLLAGMVTNYPNFVSMCLWRQLIFGFHRISKEISHTSSTSFTLQVAEEWSHVLTWDLFIGRYIWLDGLRRGIFTSHSVLLSNLIGPPGLLLHWLTCLVLGREPWEKEAEFEDI